MKFKNDIEKFEFFESVLNDSVSDSQKKEFEEALNQNDLLAKEFNDYRNLHELVIDNSVLEIKDTIASIHREALHNPAKGKGLPGNNMMFLLISGIVIISVTLFFLLKDQEPVKNEAKIIPEKTGQSVDSFHEKKMDIENNESQETAVKDEDIEEVQPIFSKTEEQPMLMDTLQAEEKELSGPEPDPSEDNLTKSGIQEKMIEVPRQSIDRLEKINQKTDNEIEEKDVEGVDCKNVSITLTFEFENSCVEEVNSGKIIITKNSLSGGTSPYYFSINGGRDYFESKFLFNYLSPGNYELFVRDINQCEERISEVTIEEEICKKDYKYSPLLGEPWIIPVEKGKSGIFRLFSRTGQIIVEKRVDDFSDKTWYGRDNNNNPLNMGYFPFIIQYTDGEVFRGSVTLVK